MGVGTGWLARSSEVALFKSLHHPVGKKGPDADLLCLVVGLVYA